MTVSIDLTKFNEFVSTRSYIEGYAPTNLDLEVFDALCTNIPTQSHPHALRWYNHIKAIKSTINPVQEKAKGTLASLSFVSDAGCCKSCDCSSKPADDFDLFCDEEEEEDAEAAAIRQARIDEYNKKKAAKKAPAAKSEVELEVKVLDDETDMDELSALIRGIEQDGLIWGEFSIVPIGYGINKLIAKMVVEDEKVSVDDIIEKISEFEDHVQSVDISSFQKI